MKAPMILDCTLRDGSYVNNFQFTQKDTESISGDLDKAGFPYIEVGHGIGLGATEKGPHKAACSDIQYMRAARKSVKKNKWGMFDQFIVSNAIFKKGLKLKAKQQKILNEDWLLWKGKKPNRFSKIPQSRLSGRGSSHTP